MPRPGAFPIDFPAFMEYRGAAVAGSALFRTGKSGGARPESPGDVSLVSSPQHHTGSTAGSPHRCLVVTDAMEMSAGGRLFHLELLPPGGMGGVKVSIRAFPA